MLFKKSCPLLFGTHASGHYEQGIVNGLVNEATNMSTATKSSVRFKKKRRLELCFLKRSRNNGLMFFKKLCGKQVEKHWLTAMYRSSKAQP